jgi:porphyrinogen peroxidase
MTSRLSHQDGISSPVPKAAHYLFLSREPGVSSVQTKAALKKLVHAIDGASTVIGFSAVLMKALGHSIEGLRTFPNFESAKVDLPSTQSDVWCWLRGDDFGELFHRSRELLALCVGVLKVDAQHHAFKHQDGRDLTGFEDGTENPKGKTALKVGFAAEGALAGSSFVAVMPWEHNFAKFDAMPSKIRNHAIGRDLKSNKELDNAPNSAHVKRTAQESFTPEAFSLRRSMPWAEGNKAGLMFVSFGHSFDAFEAQLKRMCGAEDGIVDGLFSFTRPLGGGFYWCPPVENRVINIGL